MVPQVPRLAGKASHTHTHTMTNVTVGPTRWGSEPDPGPQNPRTSVLVLIQQHANSS